ncbi:MULTISPECIES: WD40/YVTN/BNR-like repeat-containing protein [Clostridium]|uniref:WD40/YVTN/BNR-like repeat-containing protein n=1 Tax=Clostridium TaxID=1485 RepID=UPI0008243A2E|nr:MULTISPECIES: hypothetical protein [Clostridium]PJI07288.1 hypothetical protein CUB90_05155 [Clostridium sp. CT7]
MKIHKQITKKELILSVAACTVFILVYWLAFYELYILCKFGRFKNNVPILIGCLTFFVVWFIILIIRKLRKSAVLDGQSENEYENYSKLKTKWNCVVLVILVLITCFYGAKIYHDAVKYNGKLAWLLEDLRNKKTVKLQHDNIYKDGVKGLFSDINAKIHMPEKLYVATSFSLKFDSDGKITAFDTFLYGKDSDGKLKTYLISYDGSKSDDITVRLNGNANPTYSKDKLLKPLLDTMKVIPLKKTVSKWNEKQFGILYYGKRSFGYNTTGIMYIDSKGNISSPGMAFSQISGYTVSIYVPGKENEYVPVRYNLLEGSANAKMPEFSNANENKKPSFDEPDKASGQFYLSKKVGYRLQVTAAAAGSRSYSLEGTTDGGTTWETINDDPFAGDIGTASGVTFLNDKLGFLCLAKSGGSRGDLYRTEDGGKSYAKVSFPEVKVTSAGQTYNPFDLPGMPYKKNGILNALVGQGSDGDYNGNSKALYESKDNGKTWGYVKEVSKK